MRRGLMAWDEGEVPVDALRARVRVLQSAMAAADQDAIVLYTNFIRSAAVSHLTAFSPYWGDGLLLVPREGESVFATTLSKRVSSWIQSVKPVGELVNSPTPGAIIAARLPRARRLAVLELDDFPAGLYRELATALPDVEIVDGSHTFATMRTRVDAVERRLLTRADEIARGALASLNADAVADVGAAVGEVEKQARLQRAEEAYVAIAPDLDADRRFIRASGARPLGRRFAVRATVAYKGSWIRAAQTYSRDETDSRSITRADAWFADFVATLDTRQPIQGQMALPSNTELVFWNAEAAVGTRPLAIVYSSSPSNASPSSVQALVLTLGLRIDGVPWCGAGGAGLGQLHENPNDS
jgi:hypothetical protein